MLGALAERLGDRAPALLATLVGTWEGETDKRLTELRAAVGSGDAAAAARVAHAVKGGSASMGAVRLAQVCGEVEEHLRAAPPHDLRACEERIVAEVDRARSVLGALYRP